MILKYEENCPIDMFTSWFLTWAQELLALEIPSVVHEKVVFAKLAELMEYENDEI
jgi:hypothetical protein